ncbi:cell cycle family protein [Neorickettsia helminthoeca str. Oregon]|uniref:Cell wall polymerase n=1 Tax=Neorickettsia helminthoeca str. Oregon TaxID=1286528 RepID=X5HK98_9RICK|nr:FtsW/RodA/SpoVE family cell cycle protein [Neorickettsia helminthoeca]AHX11479.1 cell cycle family protein [Neorickettsia helminthoeca str. Oregon]
MILRFLDPRILLCFFLQIAAGLYVQYSASNGEIGPLFLHQLVVLIAVGLPFFLGALFLGTSFFYDKAFGIHILAISLLVLAATIGKTSMGATRWIQIMGVTFQPTELLKLSTVLMLSRYFSIARPSDLRRSTFLFLPFLHLMPVLYLIIRQPSLGTVIFLLILIFAIYYSAAVRYSFFLRLVLLGLLISPFLWKYGVKDYQKERIMTFFHPSKDRRSSGYNIFQSEIAIGSGGFCGLGIVSGPQTQLKFLPERHTDFVLSVIAEELGFFAILILTISYLVIFVKGLIIASRSEAVFTRLLSTGITTMIFLHFLINASMITGIIPVVGMPLPLISYGGSAALISMIALGVLLRIDVDQKILLQSRLKALSPQLNRLQS